MGKRHMWRALWLAWFVAGTVAGLAQETVRPGTLAGRETGDIRPEARQLQAALPSPVAGEGRLDSVGYALAVDTLRADTVGMALRPTFYPLYSDGTVAFFPWSGPGGYWGMWNLHEGFNASVGMSVSASFGKHRFPGVGFGTGISAMYAHSLTERLVLSVGGFYDHLSWNGWNENRFGFNLLAGFQLTDRVGVYAYGSKAFHPVQGNRMRIPPMPWMDNFSSRWGGMLHFKLSDAASVSLSVEGVRWER